MISLNVSFFIQLANFLLLLFAMNMILYRPIRRLVAERNGFIEKQEQGIDRANADADSALKEFEDKIRNAREKGRQQVQKLKENAYEQEKELIGRASEDAAEQVREIREKTQKEIESARAQLDEQIKAFSVELAQKILGRSV